MDWKKIIILGIMLLALSLISNMVANDLTKEIGG